MSLPPGKGPRAKVVRGAAPRRARVGLWQQEQLCGSCGLGHLVGAAVRDLPATAWARTGPKCKCGWPTSLIWIFKRSLP